MSERGKGWCPDDEGVVAEQHVSCHIDGLLDGSLHVGRSISLAPAATVDYTPLLHGNIANQGPTSSCVGQALATAVFLRAACASIPIPRPSPKALYDFGRAEDQPYVSLVDTGSRPLAVIRCGVEKGLVSEADWPIVIDEDGSSNINTRPPLDVYRDALAAKIGAFYRIPAGRDAALGVRKALDRGYFPIFAMPVDDIYEQWNSRAVYQGRAHPSLGGHMQAVAGYEDGSLIVVGSWGESFGERGIIRIANEYFDSGECTDIIVATVVPAALAA